VYAAAARVVHISKLWLSWCVTNEANGARGDGVGVGEDAAQFIGQKI
jgi:hypothetical protein